ncbi:MAG: family deacetylase, partial [Thermodesulfobacteriota bacterium]|nr:family deacetylase [Thermodesulfobacteriota bacterium]
MNTEETLIPYHATDLSGRRVLVLAPHPDDETIGCGGSLAIHARAGDPVKVVFLTNGAAGDSSGEVPVDQYVNVRQQEARNACACLGVTDLEFWPCDDRSLAGFRGALRRLIDLLEVFRPDIVYAPSPLEFHPDHRAACVLLCDALHSYPPVLDVAFYEIGQPVRVNVLVDVTQVADLKGRAMDAYESQLRERPYKDIALALDRYRSLTLGKDVMYAEGFSVWKSDIIRKIGPFSIPFQQMERLLPGPGEGGPLVSVIVRTKDRPALLANALKSIAGQTYANLEIVVVNDGGEDVQDVATALSGGIPLAYIAHETSQGRAAAANSGWRAAKGLYLNFLDDDDVFYFDHVQTLVRAIQLKGEKVVYSGVSNAYYEGPPEDPGNCVRKETIFNQAFDPDLFLFANHIPLMSVLFHRDVFEALEGFSADMDLFEDWEFLIRASRRFRFHHVDKVTAEYRFYGVADTESSHRGKYAYDQAQAAIFDRAAPYLTGEGWIKFLESELPYALGRNKRALEKGMDPLTAELRGKAKALDSLQTDYQNRVEDLARTSESLEQAAATINDLQARNRRFESLLKEIVASRGWAWLSRFRELKARVLPGGLRPRLSQPHLEHSEMEIVSLPMTHQNLKVAAVVHLYYEDLAEDLIACLKNIPIPFDLFLSTRPGSEGGVRDLFQRELSPRKMVVKGVVNRGFDIQPFLVAFSSFYGKYDLICKVHGKKSATRRELNGW